VLHAVPLSALRPVINVMFLCHYCCSDEGCLLLLAEGGEGDNGGVQAVVKAAIACGHLLYNRHLHQQQQQQQQQQQYKQLHRDQSQVAPAFARPEITSDAHDVPQPVVARILSEIVDAVCTDALVLSHCFARDVLVGKGGIMEMAFSEVEEALVEACDVVDKMVSDAEARGLVSAESAAAAAAAAAEHSRTNIACASPPLLKLLACEPSIQSPPNDSWFCCSSVPPHPPSCPGSSLAHALSLLMKTIANVCGCGGGSSSNTMRKAVMQANAAPFLVASLIPYSRARAWEGGGGILKMQPRVGLKQVCEDWAAVVREEAAAALANLVFAPQARAALIRASIIDVMEDVGYWTAADGKLLASGQSSSSSSSGARLLHETPAFIERCASVMRSLSQDDWCRKRIRGSNRLQELNSIAPQQLQDYKFFKSRVDALPCIFWGENNEM
jgi:hypothetical protein